MCGDGGPLGGGVGADVCEHLRDGGGEFVAGAGKAEEGFEGVGWVVEVVA